MEKHLKYLFLFIGILITQFTWGHPMSDLEETLDTFIYNAENDDHPILFKYQISKLNFFASDTLEIDTIMLVKKDNLQFFIESDISTNGNDGTVALDNSRWNIETNWRIGYTIEHGMETETIIGRYIDKNHQWMPFVGFDWEKRELEAGEADKNVFGQINDKNDWTAFTVGLEYTLPVLVVIQAKLFADGRFRVQAVREEIPVINRLRLDLQVDTDMYYRARVKYFLTNNIDITSHYDNDGGFGIGTMLRY